MTYGLFSHYHYVTWMNISKFKMHTAYLINASPRQLCSLSYTTQ